MKIPIYSKLKAKLESKGLDSTTSGQITWFVVSGLIALCFALWPALYLCGNSFDNFIYSSKWYMYLLFYISILLFFTAIFWLICLSFYKFFFLIHIFFCIFTYIFATFLEEFYSQLIMMNILLIVIWLFFVKMSFKFQFLFLMIYFCFEFVILIGFIPFALFYGGVSK